jgi:hypothetical protein
MGGLMVEKPSGSRQSMGLRLKNREGREYVLRSIDKDFGNGLPEIYQHTFISDIAKDQASLGYPFAAITITPMIIAAGIYHTNPSIVFVPKQERLGEYNAKYGDQLYLFEERPDGDQHDAPFFGNSKKVMGTEKLYEKIFDDNDNSVDQKAFARARLFDMFIGDWGRHADQWRWASFDDGKKTVYEPIPRDRDQTYTRFDGFFPWVAANVIGATQLESFDKNIQSLAGFNKPGRPLDMQFTNELSEDDWVRIAADLQSRLTDKVIDEGMSKLPSQIYTIHGKKIAERLRSRRDHLQDFARRYYKFLARKIAIFGTEDKEYFDINRISNSETEIKVYKIKKDGSKSSEPFYSRKIFKKETGIVYLYGMRDADVFNINGNAHDGIKIRLIGITKKDSVIRNTGSYDHKIKVYKGKSELFDSSFQNKVVFKPIIFVNPPVLNSFDDDKLNLFTRRGIHIGAMVSYHPSPWIKDSLETVNTFAVNYGITRNNFTAEYVSFKPEFLGKWNGFVRARYDGPATDNFFGIGNESSNDSTEKYYNVFSRRIFGGIGLNRVFNKKHLIEGTLFYQKIKVTKNANSYIKDKEPMLPVFIDNQYAGAELSYTYIDINSTVLPTKGFKFTAAGGYIRNLNKKDIDFTKATSSVAAYIPLGNIVSIATRVGGGYLNGTANYYHLNRLDGSTNLRGYARERFYGKSSFYNNNELRFIFDTHNYIFNGKIGVLGFFDDGRIWLPSENSNKWHLGYGGGLLVSPFNKVTFVGTYEVSDEGVSVQVRVGTYF